MMWEEPRKAFPQGRKPNPEFIRIAEECRRHPGRWALLKEYTSKSSAVGSAGHMRRGTYKTLPPTEFEFAARDEKVYIRAKEKADG